MTMKRNRRDFLALAGLAPLVAITARSGIAGAQAGPAPGGACADPASLPLTQKNRRRGLGYVEPSADPKKRCGLCAFFTPGQGDCGTCQMLSGGAVSAQAVCNSFAPKPG